MSTKKSLVEVTHDEGYGDSLLMHINLAFGGKDMRADKIVNPVASAVQVEGIPEGWELVRVGRVKQGEFRLGNQGQPLEWNDSLDSVGVNYVIIRKIEKPKRYRPFANAAEFLAHHLSGDYIDVGAGEFAKVQHCSDSGIWFSGDEDIQLYADAIADLKFRDGTPFGVEVTE